MTITTSTLTRAAGIATAVAGIIFIIIQPFHPSDNVASVTTDAWFAVHFASLGMAILGLVGITGLYLRQITKFGVLGLIAYVMFALYFVLQAAFVFAEAFIAPLTAADAPALTEDLIGLFAGHVAVTDLGNLALVGPIGAALYLIGGALFGIAVIRARILPRWTGILLTAAAAASLSAAVLPHAYDRFAAFPMGVALIALGFTLWRDQRTVQAPPAPGILRSQVDSSAAI